MRGYPGGSSRGHPIGGRGGHTGRSTGGLLAPPPNYTPAVATKLAAGGTGYGDALPPESSEARNPRQGMDVWVLRS
jgi:hypothetical protein